MQSQQRIRRNRGKAHTVPRIGRPTDPGRSCCALTRARVHSLPARVARTPRAARPGREIDLHHPTRDALAPRTAPRPRGGIVPSPYPNRTARAAPAVSRDRDAKGSEIARAARKSLPAGEHPSAAAGNVRHVTNVSGFRTGDLAAPYADPRAVGTPKSPEPGSHSIRTAAPPIEKRPPNRARSALET